MINFLIVLIVLLLLIIGLVVLQIKLSKKRNKWLGLVIPFISFLFSIMVISNMYMFSIVKTTTVSETIVTDTTVTETTPTETTESGTEIESEVIGPQLSKPSLGEMLLSATPVFIIMNIPTIIFITIYCSCREQLNKHKELERMNIQDLD